MSQLKLSATSALDLPLKGSVGSFKVGQKGTSDSIEVKFFQTHVGLNLNSGPDDKLLRHLAPFREVFDTAQLDFDQIMQRDIDDARVSSDLVPYILDNKTQDLIKFFPPIVVVALPVDTSNKPSKYYSKVSQDTTSSYKNDSNQEYVVTRSGEVGAEVFEFAQPKVADEILEHDLVELKINSSKCRLVIVDGQHRAMALLAIYRNLRDDWNDERRKSFKKYYEEWTPSHINKFDLSSVKLPMIICTVPTLDVTFTGDYDLLKAARSIFLTLNKNARPVSRTRNQLLDDNDIVASFMRRVLGEIKASDAISASAMKIENVELDQPDRQKLSSPVAVTGISHIYYLTEHLLLNQADVFGIRKRGGSFGLRKELSVAKERLKCGESLSSDECAAVSRNLFTAQAEKVLGDSFMDIYGNRILDMFASFEPYKIHNKATMSLKRDLSGDSDVSSIIFGGQSMVRVFDNHRENLSRHIDEGYFSNDEIPEIEALKQNLDQTSGRRDKVISSFKSSRASNFLLNGNDKAKFKVNGVLTDSLIEIVNDLYSAVFTSVAFQAAIVSTFFNEYELVSNDFDGNAHLNLESLYSEYLHQLNDFFVPNTFSKFKKMISIVKGAASGNSAEDFRVQLGSSDSFKQVVMPNEMAPDEWPKYRYLILEIWNPSDEALSEHIHKEREICRKQVFQGMYSRRKKHEATERRKSVEDLEKSELKEVFNFCSESYISFLKKLPSDQLHSVSKTILNDYLHETPVEDEVEE